MAKLFQHISYFENATGDSPNDYPFMNKAIIEEKLKTVKFKGANWNVTFSQRCGNWSYEVTSTSTS